RQERAGRFLAGAPGGEDEGIDVHGDAVARDPEMDARVASGAAELHRLAVAERAKRAELRAQLGVVGDGADGAVYVELGVASSVAAVLHGEADQLVAGGVQGIAPGLQELPS